MSCRNRTVCLPFFLLMLIHMPIAAQTAPVLAACDFRLTVSELRTVDSLRVRAVGSPVTLRAPSGSKLVVASLRGNAMADTTVTVSTQAFDAHHARGGAPARALAFAEGTTLPELTTFFGEEAEINRTARRGPFVVHVVFLVPANADELTVSHVCRLPGLRRVVP